jgi:hypothetical protein
MPTARSATDLLDQLFEQSWDPGLARFRSPYAFRGCTAGDRELLTGLFELAGDGNLRTGELALLRNFRKYAHHHAGNGVDSIWHGLALGQHHGLPTRLTD